MRKTTEARLRDAFAEVLGAVMATAAGAAALTCATGCSGSNGSGSVVGPGGEGGGGSTPQFTSICTTPTGGFSGNPPTLLATMHVTPELDGALWRYESAFVTGVDSGGGVVGTGSNVDGDAWKGEDAETVGAVCSKASNASACLDKVRGFRVLPTTREACKAQYPSASVYVGTECSANYILYTRGDEIGVARTTDEIKALLGTFDTLSEAMWAAMPGYQYKCGGYPSDLPGSQYRTAEDGGYDLDVLQYENCGPTVFRVLLHVDYAGNRTEFSREDLQVKAPCAVAGRRPSGFRCDVRRAFPVPNRPSSNRAIGEYFAGVATLEAASVIAFRRLYRQLVRLGAPRELTDRVREAARDEIRHARATGKLARKYGVTPAPPVVEPCADDVSLMRIALENAREGCVRETYGALVAHLQTNQAMDADVRACMRAIANEETQHAALSWDIAAWIETRLDPADRARIADERRAAFEELARDLAAPIDPRIAAAAGVPSAVVALELLDALSPVVLAPAA